MSLELACSLDELTQVLAGAAFLKPYGFVVQSCAPGECTVVVPYAASLERPGGIVSGLTIMGAADVAMWLAIMTERVPHELTFSRKVLLSTAGLATLALPILFGTLNAASARAGPYAFGALQSSRDTAADTPMLQLLRAASVPGATCPNSTPPADPFTSIKGKSLQ